MNVLTDLWLPVLLSSIFVFIVSSIIHMVLPIHKRDFKKLPAEEELLGEMRKKGVTGGEYALPCAGSMKEMSSPEMIEKYKKGPVGFLTILPSGPPAIGKSLVQWFVYSLLVGLFVAYVARLGLDPGESTVTVFRVTGTAAILGYALTYIPNSIWKGVPWGTTTRYILDGVIYGLITAATFCVLWPA
jgi:hypothetical protein